MQNNSLKVCYTKWPNKQIGQETGRSVAAAPSCMLWILASNQQKLAKRWW